MSYPARFRQALKVAVMTMQDQCVKLAYEGNRKMVLYKGKPVKVNGEIVYETEFDSQLAMFLLKAWDRKTYGDKIDTTFGPNWSGNLEDLPEEFLRQVLQQIEAQAAGDRGQADRGRRQRGAGGGPDRGRSTCPKRSIVS